MNSLFPISRFSLSNPLHGDLDTLLDSFFNTPLRAVQRTEDSFYSIPRANVAKDAEGYVIQLAAPGYSREDFGINVENNTLTISCNSEVQDSTPTGVQFTTQEYSYTTFSRSWSLPKESSADNISARYDAGILTVRIPVTTTASKTLTIDVE
jgi:HSP20 family protein